MRSTFYQSLLVFSTLIACSGLLVCCSASELTVLLGGWGAAEKAPKWVRLRQCKAWRAIDRTGFRNAHFGPANQSGCVRGIGIGSISAVLRGSTRLAK